MRNGCTHNTTDTRKFQNRSEHNPALYNSNYRPKGKINIQKQEWKTNQEIEGHKECTEEPDYKIKTGTGQR